MKNFIVERIRFEKAYELNHNLNGEPQHSGSSGRAGIITMHMAQHRLKELSHR